MSPDRQFISRLLVCAFSFCVTACYGQIADAATQPEERLEGTVVTPVIRIATFVEEPRGNALLLEVGDDLHGWRVQAIYPGEAILKASDGSMLLETLTRSSLLTSKARLDRWAPPKFHYEY